MPNLFAEERTLQILQVLEQKGAVRVAELSERFGVSEATIRRDLNGLEAEGMLTRTHGGAMKTSKSWASQLAFSIRATLHLEEKKRIGAAAGALIQDGDTVVLDAGTTAKEIGRSIGNKRVRVLTNNISAVMELCRWPAVHTSLSGGDLLLDGLCVVGPRAIAFFAEIHTDKCFLSLNGISVELGFSIPSYMQRDIKLAMAASATQVIVVADSSKFDKRSFVYLGPVTLANTIVTDSGAPGSTVDELRALGIEVLLV